MGPHMELLPQMARAFCALACLVSCSDIHTYLHVDTLSHWCGHRGVFHELGHNHQMGPYAAMVVTDSVIEVTCNWFSVYIMVGGMPMHAS